MSVKGAAVKRLFFIHEIARINTKIRYVLFDSCLFYL